MICLIERSHGLSGRPEDIAFRDKFAFHLGVKSGVNVIRTHPIELNITLKFLIGFTYIK